MEQLKVSQLQKLGSSCKTTINLINVNLDLCNIIFREQVCFILWVILHSFGVTIKIWVYGVGMVPVTVNNADMPYTQDSNGWIEVLTGIDNPQLTVLFGFHEQAFLKQLQFEGTYTSCQVLCV